MKVPALGLIVALSSIAPLQFMGAPGAHGSSVAADDVNSESILIAAGPIMRPGSPEMPQITAPSQTTTGQPPPLMEAPGQTIAPAQSPGGSQQSELFPALPSSEQQELINTAPLNMGTIEYTENLAPTSTQPGLSIVQALNETLIKGPAAAAIRAQFGVIKANYAAATQQPNPIFFFDRGLVAEQENRMGPVMSVDPIWKLFFRMLIAKRMVAQTKIDLLTQLWLLRASVRRAFVELVVARETQTTLVQLYQVAQNLSNVAEKRFKAGDVAELDVYKARLETNQAAIDAGVGSRRVSKANQALSILMGRTAESDLSIAPLPDYVTTAPGVTVKIPKSDIMPDYDKPLPPLNEFIDRAMQNRLELKSLAMQLKVNDANLKGAYGNILPDATFATGKSTAGNPASSTPTGPKLTAVFMTLDAELPFSNFNQDQIWLFRATKRQLGYQLLAQQNQVIADVSSAYNNLVAARKKIRVYQAKLLADSAEVARLGRRSYEAGQSGITAALQAQRDNVQVRSSYLDAINSYASAFTDLEFAVGKPLQ